MYLYTRDHVWVLATGGTARVGLSDFAQAELGDIAYVELPAAGTAVRRGDTVCTVDSLKSSSEIYSPLSGTIKEANPILGDETGCALINRDPLGEGWIFTIELSDPSELEGLMPEDAYAKYVTGH
jgi:glycine cleavage system H protein